MKRNTFILFLLIGIATASVLESIFNSIQSTVQSRKKAPFIHSRDGQYDSLINFVASGRIFQVVVPDVLFWSILIVIFVQGDHTTPTNDFARRYVGVPYLTILLILSLMFQTNETRFSLSRYFFESSLIRVIGYASYPIYLFQQVLLNFYLRLIYDAAIGVPVVINPSYGAWNTNEWFGNLPGWWKPIGLLIVVSFGWIVQKYFQDGFIARNYIRILDTLKSLAAWMTSVALLSVPDDDVEEESAPLVSS